MKKVKAKEVASEKNGSMIATSASKLREVTTLHKRKLVAGLVLVALAAFLWFNKSLVVVAVVNRQPVFRWDLEKRMISQAGNQVLEDITSETLIYQAAAAKGVKVSKTEVDARVTEIEKTLEGKMNLQEALAPQGLTVADFRRRLELQLLMEKMVGSQVVVTDKEMDDYVEKNKNILSATEAAGMREEARKTLIANKQNNALRQLFSDLRAKAQIIKFL